MDNGKKITRAPVYQLAQAVEALAQQQGNSAAVSKARRAKSDAYHLY